jgi:phenylalanyl-tRNA synthetase beta chain
VRIVHAWLAELVDLPSDIEQVAHELSLRGFEVAAVDDGVIDFEVTANRPDCLNHLGFAREASVIWNTELRRSLPPAPSERSAQVGAVAPGQPDHLTTLEVTVEAADLCPRYCAQVFEVTMGPSPSWLAERLEAAGVRPISNIVDITNYVMLELGQPMHAFDFDRIADRKLVIRRARPGERLRTLDGIDRTLDSTTLVIADGGNASAIGGVMGGAGSEISASTKLIALESAYFQPASVRGTSKRLGLKTEASIRFERGSDINTPPAGIARAAALMHQLGAGRPVGALIDRYPTPFEPRQISLRASRITRLLGQPVPAEEVPRYLGPLGFEVLKSSSPEGPGSKTSDHEWLIRVPTFRVDVTREVDLIEEVGRHYGFDRIPATFPHLEAPQAAPDARIERDRRISRVLTAAGFSESMTFAFIERAAADPFRPPGSEPAVIANPLSEKFAVLRPSLLPGLIDSCTHNRRRGRKDVRLFESGSRFTAGGEQRAVAFAWSGEGTAGHWSAQARPVDFFDVKGVAELLCHAVGRDALEFSHSNAPFLVRGRSADVRSGGRLLGCIGQVDPFAAEARGFPAGEELYAGEFDVDAMAEGLARDDMRTEPLPKFPAIVRDISVLVDEALPAAAVRGTIRSAAPATLESLVEFDRYQGKGVPEGRISLSLRLTFRSTERTLTDDEVEAAMDAIVEALKRAHGAERR